jgi:photosystem II stability/assembly factor-like uncharacterized protein
MRLTLPLLTAAAVLTACSGGTGGGTGGESLSGVRPTRVATGEVDMVAALVDGVYVTTRSGYYVSRDRGVSWRRLGHGYELLALDPHRPRTVFALGLGSGIVRSADAGEHWSAPDVERDVPLISVDVAPSSGKVVYGWGLGDGDGSPTGGVFVSSDGGASFAGIRDGSIGRIAVDPKDPDTAYVAADGLFSTRSRGRSWDELRHGLPRPFGGSVVSDVEVAPSDPTVVYGAAMTDDGFAIARSADRGAHWNVVLPITWVWQIAIAPTDPDVVYVLGEQTEGSRTSREHLFRTSDGGEHWERLGGRLAPVKRRAQSPDPGLVESIAVDGRDPRILFGQTVESRLARSDDGGTTWRQLTVPGGAR